MAGKNTSKLLLIMLVQQRISLKNSGLPLIMMTHCVLVCCEAKLNVTYTCFFSIADEDEDDIQNMKAIRCLAYFLTTKTRKRQLSMSKAISLFLTYFLKFQ